MFRRILLSALFILTAFGPLRAMTPEERKQYLTKLQGIIPDVPSFRQWLEKTGELPPDFDALPRVNGLPDPLKFLDGRPVRTPLEWKARRAEIRQLFEKYQIRHFPASARNSIAPWCSMRLRGNGYLIRNVRLEFGPAEQGHDAGAGDDSRWQGPVSCSDGAVARGLGTGAAAARLHFGWLCRQRRNGRRRGAGAALSELRFRAAAPARLGRGHGGRLSGDAARKWI